MTNCYHPSMKIRVVAFASVAQTLGWSQRELELGEATTVGDLLLRLEQERPALRAHLAHLAVAVDGELGDRGREVVSGQEVALLPPVSGG
jgi:molybdopterin converting factor small subunit